MFLIHKLEALEIDKLETLERLQMGLYFYKKSCVCEAYKTRQTQPDRKTEWLLIETLECF